MDKLTGEDYLNHWRARMAKGPQEAGTEQNGDDLWNFMSPSLEDKNPRSILEFGCAYGRMLRRIRARWPEAKLYGVDICKEALEHLRANWEGKVPVLFNQSVPPAHLRVDMIFTCTVLQHVTDDDVLRQIAESFRAILKPAGNLVLYENIAHRPGKGGAHMREFAAQDYMDLWPELQWQECGIFVHNGEEHDLMIGQKAL